MLLKLYKLNKRINSTKLPTTADLLISGEVVLKMATSVDKPVFTMACGADDMAKARICNYAEFQGNFFWVTEVKQISNTHIQYECSIDVLASYKSEILSTKAYVLYSDSSGRTDILDTRNIRTIDWSYKGNVHWTPNLFSLDSTGGTFVLQCINPAAHVSTTAIYLLSAGQMNNLMDKIYSTANFWDNIIKTIQNPANLMVKCYWVPCGIEILQGIGVTTNVHNVWIGNYDTEVTGFEITKLDYGSVGEVHIFDLSKIMSNDYRYDESNCILKLNLPYYGIIDVSPNIIAKTREYVITLHFDITTGIIMYRINNSVGEASTHNQVYRTVFGTEVPLGFQSYNPLPFIGTSVSSVGGLIGSAGNSNVSAISMVGTGISAVGNVVSSISSLARHNGVIGSIGSRVDTKGNNSVTINVMTNDLAESITAKQKVLGLPLCSTVELSTLTGYVQCADASVSAIAMPEELSQINGLLNGGIYIE